MHRHFKRLFGSYESVHVYDSNKTSWETGIVICLSNRVSIPVLLCITDAAGVFGILFCIVLAAEDTLQVDTSLLSNYF